ncbi:MAG: hypothetical protein OXB99_11910 [Acidimicrobiaceae bacterium]|nr:hypothetical protein [Acidimicrobiaceae bacterium]
MTTGATTRSDFNSKWDILAFDAGLITVNGGLRVHRAHRLQQSQQTDPGVEHSFGRVLRSNLRSPERSVPDSLYLSWHHQHVFLDTL